jgi:hypothetical protein
MEFCSALDDEYSAYKRRKHLKFDNNQNLNHQISENQSLYDHNTFSFDDVFEPIFSEPLVYNDYLWAYIFTGGLRQFIPNMFFHPSYSPWSFLNATSWNRQLSYFIYHILSKRKTMKILRHEKSGFYFFR